MIRMAGTTGNYNTIGFVIRKNDNIRGNNDK